MKRNKIRSEGLYYFFPALLFSRAFSLSIAFSSALSPSIDPNTLRMLALYAASFSRCFSCCTLAKKRASLRSSRIAPLRSCLTCFLSLDASFRSWSGSCARRYDEDVGSNFGIYEGIGIGLCACRRRGRRASLENLRRRLIESLALTSCPWRKARQRHVYEVIWNTPEMTWTTDLP